MGHHTLGRQQGTPHTGVTRWDTTYRGDNRDTIQRGDNMGHHTLGRQQGTPHTGETMRDTRHRGDNMGDHTLER